MPVRTEHRGLDIGTAMAWGEVVAEDAQTFSLSKGASWRKGKASDAQVGLAERMGIPGAREMRRGALSDALSVAFASQRLDRFAKWA